MKRVNTIFEHTDCLSEDMLTKYVSGKLSPAEKHEVEKHLIDCEMCSDAVEGLGLVRDKRRISSITTDLNRNIQDRTERKVVKVVFLRQYRTQMAVAASVVLLVSLVWFFRSNITNKDLDPASSEKIFADKFEPYPADAEKDVSNSSPVSESTAPIQGEITDEEKEANRAVNTPASVMAENKKTVVNEPVVSNDNTGKFAQEGGKGEQEYYRIKLSEKKAEAPVPGEEPKVDANEITETRDEAVAYDKSEQKTTQQAPAKSPPVTTTATGASATTQATLKKDKAKQAKMEEEAAKNQEGEEVLALETKSKSGKSRGKFRSDEKSNQNAETQTSTPQAVSGNTVPANTTTDARAVDSVSAFISAGDDRDMAMQKYEQKNYEGAALDFEKMLAKDPTDYNALFYSAVSYLSTGQTDKAIINLNKVLEKKDGEFYDAAQWYLSLAYIKKNDSANARKNLTELQKNPKSKYQKQADETLKEMNK